MIRRTVLSMFAASLLCPVVPAHAGPASSPSPTFVPATLPGPTTPLSQTGVQESVGVGGVTTAAGAPAAVGLPPLELGAGGPLRIEAGRPVRLHLGVPDRASFWGHVRAVGHDLAPSAAVEPSPAATAPVEVSVRWSDPAGPEQVVLFRGGSADISVPSGGTRRGRYTLTWTDPVGRLAVQLPAGTEGYPVDFVAPGASTVIAGPGTKDLVVYGEELPLEVEVADAGGVAGATVHHRSAPATEFSTTPMKLESGEIAHGVWKAAVPRPGGAEASVEYFVEIENTLGARTWYGSNAVPFRIHLPDPTSQP